MNDRTPYGKTRNPNLEIRNKFKILNANVRNEYPSPRPWVHGACPSPVYGRGENRALSQSLSPHPDHGYMVPALSRVREGGGEPSPQPIPKPSPRPWVHGARPLPCTGRGRRTEPSANP